MLRFRCDHVANTLSVTTNRDRASPLLAGSPTEQRLTALHSRSPPQRTYGLLQTRPRGSFAAQPAALKPPGQFRAAPLPHRCRVPSVRAPGQDFHLRSQHPYSAHQGRRCATRCARPCRTALDRRAPLRSMAGKGCAGRATLHRSRAFPRWAALCRRRLRARRFAGAESPARRPQRFDLRDHVARSRCGAAPRSVVASPAPTCVQVPSDPLTVQRPCSEAKSVGRVTYDHPRSPSFANCAIALVGTTSAAWSNPTSRTFRQ